MDLQALSQLFASTFSPDPNVQKMAELQIRKVWTRASGTDDVLTARRVAWWTRGHDHERPSDRRER